VYGICRIFRRYSTRYQRHRDACLESLGDGPCLASIYQDWENVGPAELHLGVCMYIRPPDVLLKQGGAVPCDSSVSDSVAVYK